MSQLSKEYDFKSIKEKLQKYWKDLQVYKWNETESREETFVVDTPPPTVSGQLHLGHIFSYSHTDFIVRFQRMLGKNIFYPIGFDDNGLPTERLVQKKKNINALNFSREEFIKICYEVILEEEEKFRNLFNTIGFSFDWSLEYQTISPLVKEISQLSFLDLVEKGQIYRRNQPVLWDTVDQTALSQAEIEDKEKSSIMNDIYFELLNGAKISIATTRPELLPACVAIFVNPADSRYQNLVGEYAITPLFKIKVPILADENVDIQKGTGIVMCCTFGDITDVMWWRKYNLSSRVIIDKQGKIINPENIEETNFLKDLIGLKVNQAREKILVLLKDNNLLIKQTNITHVVKCAERSGAPLEILLTPQWFIKSLEHKKILLELSNRINWFPTHMKHRLDIWIQSLSWDWCISRQRFFGVPIPVWYSKRKGEEGKIIFAKINNLPIDPISTLPEGYSKEEVEPELDIFDTWATSSVTPQINSQAINKEFSIDYLRHKKLFPADLRTHAHEIIRTWTFSSILKSYLHENSLPWKNLMISGWCLSQDKSKMSKSKGNIIDPEKMLDQYGADVVRYWAANSRLGVDTVYSDDVMHNGKRLINKLWNSAKFANIHFSELPLKNLLKINQDLYSTDLWILAKLNNVIESATTYLSDYNYSLALEIIESFFWKDFCDNFLEIIKQRIYNKDTYGHDSSVFTLYHVLLNILKLLAPFLPYITEEIFQILFAKSETTNKSIHQRCMWPNRIPITDEKEMLSQGNLMIEVLSLVRKAKAQYRLSVKAPIKCLEIDSSCLLNNDLIQDLKYVTASDCVIYTTIFAPEGFKICNDQVTINIVYPLN